MGGRRLTSGASTPKGASTPAKRVSGEGRGREENSRGRGSSDRQSTQARWMAMDRMPQYRRAKHERKEAREAGAAVAARCSTRARTRSTLSWLHRPPISQAPTTNLIWWAWPASSGYLCSLSWRATENVAPSRWWEPKRTAPAAERGERRVASTTMVRPPTGHLWLFALGIFASARRVGLSPLHLSKVPYLTQVSKMQLTQTIKNDRPVPYVHILSMLIHQRRKSSSTVSGEGRRLYAE